MTKTSRNTAAAAEDSFHKHYAAIWGVERWHSSLYTALAEPTRYAALVNHYAPVADFWQAIDEAQIKREELQQLELPRPEGPSNIMCLARTSEAGFPPPKQTSASQRLTHWNLDAASALVAQLLDTRPEDKVLDMCAAPGGKSIVLAQSMFQQWHAVDTSNHGPTSYIVPASAGMLRANETDGRRQKRLVDNLQAYLPAQFIKQGNIQCLRADGTGTAVNALLVPGGYDKVLVDAPCSSERHIIHAHLKAKASGNTASEMANWRPGSSKRLAVAQLSLLMTALRAAKVGGKVVYATCSIETAENDGVVEKMLAQVEKERKKGGKWNVKLGFEEDGVDDGLRGRLEEWAERTKYGWIVLPDHPGGGKWGPLFFAMVTKIDAP